MTEHALDCWLALSVEGYFRSQRAPQAQFPFPAQHFLSKNRLPVLDAYSAHNIDQHLLRFEPCERILAKSVRGSRKARLRERSAGVINTAARLLGVSADSLVHCLTAREVTAGTTHVTIFL